MARNYELDIAVEKEVQRLLKKRLTPRERLRLNSLHHSVIILNERFGDDIDVTLWNTARSGGFNVRIESGITKHAGRFVNDSWVKRRIKNDLQSKKTKA